MRRFCQRAGSRLQQRFDAAVGAQIGSIDIARKAGRCERDVEVVADLRRGGIDDRLRRIGVGEGIGQRQP